MIIDQSVTDRAYRLLRAELISCRVRPGSRLNIAALQGTLSLSQAAVREALSRLTAEGLVEIERNRGFRVAPVSVAGFRDLAQACLTVEIPCLRSSIAVGGRDWELTLVASYGRACRVLEQVVAGREDVDAYWTERQAFHEALLGACENRWLLWSWRMLYAQLMRYRQMYLPLATFELELGATHRTFLDAALARDVETAVALNIENDTRVASFIEAHLAAPDL